MEALLTSIAILLALVIWIIQTEHNSAVQFFAYTKIILKQLKSVLNPYGSPDSLEFAQLRCDSFEKEVIPYIVKWRVLSEEFLLINKRLHNKYCDQLEDILLTFKTKLIILGFNESTSEDKRDATNFLLGLDDNFKKRITNFLSEFEDDFQEIIHHPYKSYIKKIKEKIYSGQPAK